MAKFTRKFNRKRAGLSPGSTEFLPPESTKKSISLWRISEGKATQEFYENLDSGDIFKRNEGEMIWLNINGLNKNWVEKVGNLLGLHPLFQEDILHIGQRPKLDEGDNYLYLVLSMLKYDASSQEVLSEQVSFVFNRDVIVTFQEKEGDIFDPIRYRLVNAKGKIRKSGADYLAYAMLDVIVDQFYIILEQLGDRIEMLEERVVKEPNMDLLKEINFQKREFIFLRKNIWPLREVLNGLMNPDQVLLSKNTRFHVKDVYDHTIQIMDSIDTYREMLSSTLDIYMSSVSNRLNNVMKTLTIIATIFIPLTFLVGVYGMNFRVMPELEWEWGYYVVWAIMIATTLLLLVFFRRKGWL